MDTPPIEPAAALAWLPLLLQTVDPLFPTGAYAHSHGLEEIVRMRVVHDEATLGTFLLEHLAPALEHFELPVLRLAYRAAANHDYGALAEIDEWIGASKLPLEARSASLRLGERRLAALLSILPDDPRLIACAHAIELGRLSGHHLVICAVQGFVSGAPLEAVLTTYFYQSMAAAAGAALKLIRIGQAGIQRALHAAMAPTPQVVARSLLVEREKIGWFDPLLECAGMRHERALERLFIS